MLHVFIAKACHSVGQLRYHMRGCICHVELSGYPNATSYDAGSVLTCHGFVTLAYFVMICNGAMAAAGGLIEVQR